jgi:hypothetical protein
VATVSLAEAATKVSVRVALVKAPLLRRINSTSVTLS